MNDHDNKIRAMQGKPPLEGNQIEGERIVAGANSGPGSVPEIVGITKVLHEQPVYRVRLLGLDGEMEVPSYSRLRSYTKFTDLVAEKWDHVFDERCPTWRDQLRQAMARIMHEEPPPDTHMLAVMLEHLTEFLTNRQVGDRKEDLLLGHPWGDAEAKRHYFRLMDLMRHLVREDVRGPDGKRAGRNTVARWLKELGGEDARLAVVEGEPPLRVWWVPSAIIVRRSPVEPKSVTSAL
ncbi:hypothetical protein AUC71_15020 [Methyloceanibacter marginalis]|uniref:Uncharacterized protein n=1 Tax=Methyloceanibacter marginalis TaxID=1774971 RepID=A0A1E3W9J3_9HYPH|nr:hypothetical protein [Methyloceanibacter marginalis]ODS02495.1 hypothetical protein AUC71_15020 [Methyloceanibacter marginalis]